MDINIDGILSEIKIPSINIETNFWMIRTKRGAFFNEFINNKFIAIGWNVIIKKSFENTEDDYLKKLIINSNYPDKQPGTGVNKCRRFICELKTDDIVMIVGSGQIAFAKIGEYFESPITYSSTQELEAHKQIESGFHNKIQINCPYNKRRSITVLSIIDDIDKMNPILFKALVSNRHSLSCLNEYSDTILSSCFDIYYHDDSLITTFRIQKSSPIDPIVLSKFIQNITYLLTYEVEASISAKININSPGDLVLKTVTDCLIYLKQNGPYLLLIYFSIFGGKYKDAEFNSLISLMMKFLKRKHQEKEDNLKLEKQSLENKKLQAETDAMQIANAKAEFELESMAKNLLESSSDLQIRGVNENIIPLSRFLRDDNI